ncbi:MAG: hypothetical protein WC506_03460 [Candidatus Micrarchaeia archaeon]
MGTFSPPQNVDTAFRQLCAILFGREVGELAGFGEYLREAMMPYTLAKSENTGSDVFLSNPYYPKKARFASQQELEKAKPAKASVNDIKDIDSLFRAASESMVYCGDKVFGRNANTALVDNAIDCIDVYYSHNVRNVKRGAFISYVRESECVFGIPAFPKIRYSMRCLEGINANRMFETYYTNNSSDMYYSFNCNNCSDCIFCFNLRAKRHAIGNMELEKGKYLELKKKLASEMAELLEKNRRLPSLSDLAGGSKGKDMKKEELIPTSSPPASVEKAWSEATGIVVGRRLPGISDYEPWLQARALKVFRLKGKTGKYTYKPQLPLVRDIPGASLCTRDEAVNMCQPLITLADAGEGFEKLGKKAAGKASITMEMMEGACMEVPEVTQAIDSTESWSMWDATNSSRSACTTAAIQSKYAFGGFFRMLDSEFTINCYDVVECKRCLEVDSSSRCSDCYFCHNCEACENCILCSNAKGLRFAVLNVEVGREKYMEIRKMLLAHIADGLEKDKRIDESIFDM